MIPKSFRLFGHNNHISAFALFVFLICLLIPKSYSAPDTDQMDSIPGYANTFTDYIAYAGYLNTTSQLRRIHYVFIQNGKSNNSLPVTLWMNGGPGCASKIGFLQ